MPFPAVETNYQPGKRRDRVVLSFVQSLLPALRESALAYYYINPEDLEAEAVIDLRIGAERAAEIRLGRARLLLRDVAAVLWRPPSWMMFTDTKRPERTPAFATTVHRRRWSQFMRDLASFLPRETLWLPSHPLNGSQDWQNRLAELALARDVGLRVPETICTNDPEEGIAFLERAGGKAFYREWGIQPFLVDPSWVTTRDIARNRAQFARAPNVLMAYVPKAYEVRAVVVGDRVFAVRIDSQASPSPKAREDWREYDFTHVKWEPMRLPKTLETKVLRLMKLLDLRWGSFDLIKATDGAFYFLEVNRPGAFAWLEPLVGLDVAKEVTSYLEREIAQ